MSEELKPCPFCDGELFVFGNSSDKFAEPSYSIMGHNPNCYLYRIGMPRYRYNDKDLLIHDWNTRTPTKEQMECNHVLNIYDYNVPIQHARKFGFDYCPDCGIKLEVDE